MANKDYNKEDGVWRTIGGRRVFIKNGQSLADAMRESGKFKSSKEIKIGDERDKKLEDVLEKNKNKTQGELRRAISESEDETEKIGLKKLYDDMISEDKNIAKAMNDIEKENKEATSFKDKSNEFVKKNLEALNPDSDEYTNSLNKYLTEHGELGGKQGGFLVYNSDENEFYKAKLEHDKEYLKSKNDYDDFRQKALNDDEIRLSTKYLSPNGTQLNVIAKDVSDRYIVNEAGNEYRVKEDELRKILKDGQYSKSEYRGVKKEENDVAKDLEKFTNEYKAEREKYRQENPNDPDYKLYKKAMIDPDSIDPMTEWSTDWEELDKKYRERWEKEQEKARKQDQVLNEWGNTDKARKILSKEQEAKENGNIESKSSKEESKINANKRIPTNLSKYIYETDVDKGNAWSGNAIQKTSNGKQFVEVYRNGPSQNSAQDIAEAITKKYPYLEAKVNSDRSVIVSVKEETTGNQISNSIQRKAYQKYMKEHPNSKKSFEDFKNMGK